MCCGVATALRRIKADKDISSDQVRWLFLCCCELRFGAVCCSVATALWTMDADAHISSDQVRWLLFCCSLVQCVAVCKGALLIRVLQCLGYSCVAVVCIVVQCVAVLLLTLHKYRFL